MKPLVIYHGNCADGFGAAWCFHHFAPDTYDFHPGVYQDAPPDVTDRDVYLVDFSYKRPVVEGILERAKSVTLIDHHATAIDDLRPLFTAWGDGGLKCHCALDRSGAMLAWQHLFGEGAPPPLIRHIEDRDLWLFKLPETRAIQAAVFSYPYDFATWDRLMLSTDLQVLATEGRAIERKHHKDIAELVKVCQHRRQIGDYDVPVASLPYTLTSDAGHLMAEGEPFAACYWDTPSGRVFSLRSTDAGIDVSAIAKLYGGGGHKHAAGFRVPFTHHLAGPPLPPLKVTGRAIDDETQG